MNNIQDKYYYLCVTPSDINEHLPTLYNYASECESVIELGVRGCVSSWAFVNGLLNNNKNKRKIFFNDIKSCDIQEILNATNGLDIVTDYQWVNDLDLNISENYDITFIDTWHIYGHLKRELDKFSKVTNKYIIMHDTTVDAFQGETIRCGWDANKQSLETGIPVEEINCGLQLAIDEFLELNTDWVLFEKYENNNGLTVLKKRC
jgi:hypothetical protein